MREIIRIQLRQARRIPLLRTALIAVLLTAILGKAVFLLTDDAEMTASETLLSGLDGLFIAMALSLTGIFCGGMVAADLEDQTVNYELTTGRLRRDVYFGRAIPAVGLSLLCTMLCVLLPFLLHIALRGWGNALPRSAALMRYFLLLLPVLRISCFCTAATFIFKKQFTGIMLGMSAMMLCGSRAIGETASGPLLGSDWLLGTDNMARLMEFESWRVYDLSFNSHIFADAAALPVSVTVMTVTVSLLMSAVWLLIGYHFFHTDDLH